MADWEPGNNQYPPPKANEPGLHRAARVGDNSALRELVAAGHPVDAFFFLQLDPDLPPLAATPLMVAAGSGDGADVSTVHLLLALGATADLAYAGLTATSFACTGLGWNYQPGGDVDRLDALLQAGCPLPTSPALQTHILCAAAAAADPARVGRLLAEGIAANTVWDEAARDEAVERQRVLIEEMVAVQENGDSDAVDDEEVIDIAALLTDADDVRIVGAPSSFQIPLFQAAEGGSAACVELLLSAGADVTARNDMEQTALWSATSAEVADVLVRHGLSFEDVDHLGWSALVTNLDDPQRVAALLAIGANVNATHDRGNTVFMSAVGSQRNPEVLRMLIAAGADPHAISELGYNAWHSAIDVTGEANDERSVRDTFSYLKELGVDHEQHNRSGATPLTRAIFEGTATEVRVLCEVGVAVNEPNLLFAVISTAVAPDRKLAALLATGASQQGNNSDGQTVVQFAQSELKELDEAKWDEVARYRDQRRIELTTCVQLLGG